MNEKKLLKFAAARIGVKIENRNQEKRFIHICKVCGHSIVRKDETAYVTVGARRKAIFPIYYEFELTRMKSVVSWWSLDEQPLRDNNYIIIDFKNFLNNMEGVAGYEKDK